MKIPNFKHFPESIIYPTILADSDRFSIKIAETEEEIKKTLKLRYHVFNVEQGKGLDSATVDGIDMDEFDEYCLHLIVQDKVTGDPIGTYRIHLGSIAAKNSLGFYSANEYDIKGLNDIADKSMEVGRSCVKAEFRKGSAVALLWGGIGELMMRAKLQYLLGCVSMEKFNPAAAWALYENYKSTDMVTDLIVGKPKEKFMLERPSDSEISLYLDDIRNTTKTYVPPLMKGYLKLGTKIAGEPLYDPDFHTIDYLILLDSYAIPERYSRHYNYKP